MPNHYVGDLLRTMAISGLSRVRTELMQLAVVQPLTPHPVPMHRQLASHRYLRDLPSSTQVIRLLRPRLRTGKLLTDLPDGQVEQEFLRQENRWWSVKLQSLGSKEQFLRYAGRYARRPPIAQRRILGISKQEITFCAKDRRLRRQVIVRLTPKEFLAAWIQHVPERYEHRVRSFGMFAPRVFGNTSAAVFAILGQSRGVRPKPLPWRLSIKRDFEWDPLLDRQGNRMTWNRRIGPQRH